MKILAIMGTGRIGNTAKVVERVENRIRDFEENLEFEYLYLNRVDLQQCLGCHNCIFTGEEYCPHKDERIEVEKKILDSDGVIFASPGYVSNVTGIMKNFFDRFAYRCHRPIFFDKKALVVSTAASPMGPKAVNRVMRVFVEASGFHLVDELGLSMLPIPMTNRELVKTEQRISKKAKDFYRAVKNRAERPPLKLNQIIAFRVFKRIAKEYPTKFIADYRYFSEIGAYEKGSKWYVSVRINPIKNLIAGIMEFKIKRQYKNMFLNEYTYSGVETE